MMPRHGPVNFVVLDSLRCCAEKLIGRIELRLMIVELRRKAVLTSAINNRYSSIVNLSYDERAQQ